MTVKFILFILISILPITVFARDEKRSSEKKTTSINFEDELIEGEVKKPELLYLLQKKQFNFKRLIKLRENFLPEMERTSQDVNRVRGKN